jgi:DNA-binding NarL/FixJ family response regulator
MNARRLCGAADAVLLREGLVRILTDDGHQVTAAVGSGPELVRATRAYTPQMVIADVRMPPNHTDDGIVAVREIRRHLPQTAAILLSNFHTAADEHRRVKAVLTYLNANAT